MPDHRLSPDHGYFANLIWQIADLLRGPYRPPQYERVMLPMTVLRRFDCVLAPTKAKVLAEHARLKGGKVEGEALDRRLNRTAGQRFHNHSPLDFEKLKGDPDNVNTHLVSYIQGFSRNVRDIFEFFEFENEIERMREANILYLVVSQFAAVDLHPSMVPNEQMGLIFENLIRRFNELANETAGDHFTPREIIRLMVSILFIQDDELLATPGAVRKLLDPACGTGGMLAQAQSYLREHHGAARLFVYGQEYNRRAFATAASDMLMKQVDHNGGGDNVRFGDSLTGDEFKGETFDYFLTNPPFGVDWKQQRNALKQEHDQRGFDGRFGAGLPRVNDGSLLFLQHMWDKREPVRPAEHKHGSRLAIVFSGSPLFAGGAGSGESNIRKWIIENDWLEAIIALPEQMFYNTGIGTYIWILTNRKEKRRKGKVQLLDARSVWTAGGSEDSKRSLGDKRRHLSGKQIDAIVKLYGRLTDGETSKTFDSDDFGYTRVTVERPLRLRYRMTLDDKARFLDACPHLLDDVQAILRPGSTIFGVEAPQLRETARDQFAQTDLWSKQPGLDDTALDLVARSIREIRMESPVGDYFDGSVLDAILMFPMAAGIAGVRYEMIPQGAARGQFALDDETWACARDRLNNIPAPRSFVVSGRLDEIKHGNGRFRLLVNPNSALLGRLDAASLHVEALRSLWGRQATVEGTVHFKPDGRPRFIEARRISARRDGDSVFEDMPSVEIRQPTDLFPAQYAQAGAFDPIDLAGSWPGDESIEELLAQLD